MSEYPPGKSQHWKESWRKSTRTVSAETKTALECSLPTTMRGRAKSLAGSTPSQSFRAAASSFRTNEWIDPSVRWNRIVKVVLDALPCVAVFIDFQGDSVMGATAGLSR